MTLEIVTKATGCIFDEYTIVTENDFTNPSWHDLHLKGEYTLLIF
jgi:hypothetical protein